MSGEGKAGEANDGDLGATIGLNRTQPLLTTTATFSETKEWEDELPEGSSAACRLTSNGPVLVDELVFKFTTLSDGDEQASFIVGTAGGAVGRAPGENVIFVPSDATLARCGHAQIEFNPLSNDGPG
eukprot:CAMPEP_0172621240 /NCGR_PEP_ID=MMETSP1068-20121228/110500_1 /TAXON_ID=35684 /ORGANISM="Pseudopedinella elastica, Strain CCMP716" /LENGTH=126 /DNA_ID=CAMNT_0013428909 /DNA_START=70 /DNA_END=446 /DNA_ORIENTATION=-